MFFLEFLNYNNRGDYRTKWSSNLEKNLTYGKYYTFNLLVEMNYLLNIHEHFLKSNWKENGSKVRLNIFFAIFLTKFGPSPWSNRTTLEPKILGF